jgi:chromosomal replication initiation ATPase DnaA
VEEVKSHLNEEKEEKPLKDISPKIILMAVSNRLVVSAGRILGDSQGKEVSLSRGLVAYLAKREGGQSGKQVADFLNRDPSVIVRMVEKVESKIQEDNSLRRLVETLARSLAKRG